MTEEKKESKTEETEERTMVCESCGKTIYKTEQCSCKKPIDGIIRSHTNNTK